MAKYHLNPETGNPGQCTAAIQCPFGGDEVHYPTAEDARIAFEHSMAGQAFGRPDPGQGMLPGMDRLPERFPAFRGFYDEPEREGMRELVSYLRTHRERNLRPGSVIFSVNGTDGRDYDFTLAVQEEGPPWTGTVTVQRKGPEGTIERWDVGDENMDEFVLAAINARYVGEHEVEGMLSREMLERRTYEREITRVRRDLDALVDGAGIIARRGTDETLWLTDTKKLKRADRKLRETEQAWLQDRMKAVDWADATSVREFVRALDTRRNELEEAHPDGLGEANTWINGYWIIRTNMPFKAVKDLPYK